MFIFFYAESKKKIKQIIPCIQKKDDIIISIINNRNIKELYFLMVINRYYIKKFLIKWVIMDSFLNLFFVIEHVLQGFGHVLVYV